MPMQFKTMTFGLFVMTLCGFMVLDFSDFNMEIRSKKRVQIDLHFAMKYDS